MSNYPQTLEWLFSQLPMYQRTGKSAYKADLQNTIDLDNHLGNPHMSYKTIHVAGTNGKGSTCHLIASALQEAGYKVGLYTSPHLKDFRERIKVNGEMCEKTFVVDFVKQHKEFFLNHQLSFFEMTLGMAFQYFKEQKVDIAVIETGLGGRLDSTNIIQPMITAITNIAKDHTAILGNTFTKIATEKAGIIKERTPIVIGEQKGFLKSRFRESAGNKNALIHLIDHRSKSLPTDLKGTYQKANTRLAQKVLHLLRESNEITITSKEIASGFLNVVRNTGLRGRYEVINEKPKTILDTAHNVAGITQLLKQVLKEPYENLHVVMGMVSDKDVNKVLQLLSKQATYYLARPDIPRGMPVKELSNYFTQNKLTNKTFKTVNQAFDGACLQATKNDLILVTGSTFVVAEII
ncbi:dihydrofolate synthase/folylpolyglutamate synthase [Nonlabens dokdonensis]|nr:dihydrofolate synthase/folylpolyglutamate synthase [Nonlabens dokdonensis]